ALPGLARTASDHAHRRARELRPDAPGADRRHGRDQGLRPGRRARHRPFGRHRKDRSSHMTEKFDVVILGAGPAGEVALNTLAKAGLKLALVEQELIGGECTNWGCIPSKTLLRPPELKNQSTRAAGVGTPALDWPGLSDYRDYMVSNHDDTKKVARYEERGVTVVKEA